VEDEAWDQDPEEEEEDILEQKGQGLFHQLPSPISDARRRETHGTPLPGVLVYTKSVITYRIGLGLSFGVISLSLYPLNLIVY
jgi:hypothetical protein